MKRFLLLMLVLMMTLSSFCAYAAKDYISVVIDGVELEAKDVNGNRVYPMLENGTTYLPVRAIANALKLDIQWDDHTKTVFINGVVDSEKTDVVNVFVNGVKLTPTDVNGKVVNPILKDGTTYLPIRAISEKFNKEVSWDQETHTVFLTTPTVTELEEGKTYAFVNKANKKAISLTDAGLVLEAFSSYIYQGFTLTKADVDGYYYITASNDKNFDVNGNSKNPGAKIITYNKGTADNQKFKVEKTADGYIIYALSSLLPIEDSAGVVKQNTKRESLVQKWDIVEFTPVEKESKEVFFTINVEDFILTDESCAYWQLVPNSNGEYIITNPETNKSLDVANNSKTSGDPIITYKTSGDANQRWTFEKQEDGTYLIKSVHSGLYLSVSDNTLIHGELNESYKQNWTVSVIK